MEELRKISSLQLYLFWKNLSVGLLAIIATVAFTRLLPYYFSPVVSLVAAGVLYTMIYNHRVNKGESCMIIPYAVFYCLISYCIVSIAINMAYLWGLFELPDEIVYFNTPYIPVLLMMPVSAVTMTVIYFRRRRLRICAGCRAEGSRIAEQGMMGRLMRTETHFQVGNLSVLFSITSVIIWVYYIFLYNPVQINSRDSYIFFWLTIIVFLLDELYFIFRYYNIYLDLKENDEIIDQEESESIDNIMYVRFYVICGNDMYLDPHCIDAAVNYREVIDTPFVLRRNINGMNSDEIREAVEHMTGVDGGELRFFYGRRLSAGSNRSLLRYFYFLNGSIENFKFRANGQWVDFDFLKEIYSHNPGSMSPTFVGDITRLATIMLTEKTFDEHGFRRNRIKSYNPTFNLIDVRKSRLNFQDDKWINISLFNSDVRFYRMKRWIRNLSGRTSNSGNPWE